MKLSKLITAVFSLSALFSGCTDNVSGLQNEISELLEGFPGEVGVAVVCGKDTVCINADGHFPMFSVVKFPQALAVTENAQLDEAVPVTADDLKPDTWSPMREKYPDGENFTVSQIIEYALIESDNNASDILFDRFASPGQVEAFMKDMGITDCSIKWSEAEQHTDISRCNDNWITPMAAVRLLGKFHDCRKDNDRCNFIWDTMTRCSTGADRIPKYILDKAAAIVHKTGTGFDLGDGTVSGVNDIACIVLPDSGHIELAVFIKDAECDGRECEELIAKIARAAMTVTTI